jgi:hypothetical protein
MRLSNHKLSHFQKILASLKTSNGRDKPMMDEAAISLSLFNSEAVEKLHASCYTLKRFEYGAVPYSLKHLV